MTQSRNLRLSAARCRVTADRAHAEARRFAGIGLMVMAEGCLRIAREAEQQACVFDHKADELARIERPWWQFWRPAE